jgi:hypothetical protein
VKWNRDDAGDSVAGSGERETQFACDCCSENRREMTAADGKHLMAEISSV